MVRVFVPCTGRCGSTTFWRACSHMTNFTASHDGDFPDLDFPDNHIAVGGCLFPVVPRLRRMYPEALFVWLRREREASIESWARKRSESGRLTVDHHRDLWVPVWPSDPHGGAERLHDMVSGYLGLLPWDMIFWLETAREQWPTFWNMIRAEGNYEAAIAEWDVRHNAG